MSRNIINETWDNANLPSGEKFLLIALAKYTNDADIDEPIAWPSVPTLAWRISQTERTVRRLLRNLEALGYIKTERGVAPGGGNLYTLLCPWREEKRGRILCPGHICAADNCNLKGEDIMSAESYTKEPILKEKIKMRARDEENLKRGMQFWSPEYREMIGGANSGNEDTR